MRRPGPVPIIAGLCVMALVTWIVSNTYWDDVHVPMPLKGEAATNPFYASERFLGALGAHTAWEHVFTTPPTTSVIVLSGWHWDLSRGRRAALEGWVESGGRLIVDQLLQQDDTFQRWSGIRRKNRELKVPYNQPPESPCLMFDEENNGPPSTTFGQRRWLCDFNTRSSLVSSRPVEWALRGAPGTEVLRVRIGRGSVTVINGMPFIYRKLFDGDHAWLLATAAQLVTGDDVRFLSEQDHESLLALAWQHGAPVIALGLVALGLGLWRGAVRFGPPAAIVDPARRSLAEQIRGTGQFAFRHGEDHALHTAAVRALDEAARRRIPGYLQLAARDRTDALAHLTGIDAIELSAVVYHPARREPRELRATLALLESARRRLLIDRRGTPHGTR